MEFPEAAFLHATLPKYESDSARLKLSTVTVTGGWPVMESPLLTRTSVLSLEGCDAPNGW